MKGERRFRAWVLLTALLGQFAYAMAAEKPFFLLLGIVAGLFSARQVSAQMTGTAKPVWRGLLNALVLAAIANLVFQLLPPQRQEPITSLTDFLSYVMLVKMLDRGRMRDEAQLLGLSLFVVIGSLLTGQSLALGIGLALYTPMAILCTVMLQVFAGRERIGNRLAEAGIPGGRADLDAAVNRTRGWRSLLATGVACVVLSMGAGVVGFMVTPRQLAQMGGTTGPLNKSATTTGFSDEMRLGGSSVINEDTQPVMDIVVRADRADAVGMPAIIYLRGGVLDTYDPRTGNWSTHEDTRDFVVWSRTAAPQWEARQGLPQSITLRPARPGQRRWTYDIVQRNTQNRKEPLFSPLQPLNVTTDAAQPVEYSASTSLLRTNSQGGRLAYSVTASPDSQPEAGTAAHLEEFSPAIAGLAREILADARVDIATINESPANVRFAAQAVANYLGTFHYTLEQVAPPENTDPIEHFLFERRAGHCEYFAAAMTALMDSVGVPTRVVTGYAAAEYNPVSGRYTVRKSDAHAWVEVCNPEGRWETFDPTPSSELPATRRRQSGPLAWLSNLWGAIEFSWLDNVVAYDRGIRIDLGAPRTGSSAAKWQSRLTEWSEKVKSIMPKDVLARSVVIGGLVFGVVMAVFGTARLGGRMVRALGVMLVRAVGLRRRRGAGNVVITEQTKFYGHALDALVEGGVGKPETVTPLRHAAEGVAARNGEAGGAFERVTRLYYAARFGGRAPSAAEREAAEGDVRLLRQRLVKAPAN